MANKNADTLDLRAAQIKGTIAEYESFDNIPQENLKQGCISATQIKKNILKDMKEAVRQVNSLRGGNGFDARAIDISFGDYTLAKFGMSLEAVYQALELRPSMTTIDSLMTQPEFNEGYRWLVPEIIREAVRLGLRKNPIYSELIAAEETVAQKKITMPQINMSDALPVILNEAETIPVGSVSFGEKDVRINKIGTGLKITDEVMKYVSLNILALYLQDAGVKLGLGLDAMLIDVLINGETDDNAHSAAVIGVDTTGSIVYKDLLRAWLRMGRLGRTPTAMLSNEGPALDILLLDEFKGWSDKSNQVHKTISVKTPIPQSQSYLIHGSMPATNQLMLVDSQSSVIKLNATGLMVESDRIAERQISGTYMTITTGFATLFRDGRLIIDHSLAYSSNGFPTWMDVGAEENITIE